jgi:hypothetical protein
MGSGSSMGPRQINPCLSSMAMVILALTSYRAGRSYKARAELKGGRCRKWTVESSIPRGYLQGRPSLWIRSMLRM